jgi:Fe-S-cluster containining protein
MARGRKTSSVGDTSRGAKRRGSRGAATNESFGYLFEPGRKNDLLRALAAKVTEGLTPDAPACECIDSLVEEIVSEREGGWHFALSSERLFDLRANGRSSQHFCDDCSLPGCCYFETIRLTSEDVERLATRLQLSFDEFVAQHCVPFVDNHDRRYSFALKEAQPCAFLEAHGLCRVYADRPTVCSEFPFVVDRKTGDVKEIRLFPFCNVPFNVLRLEVIRRAHKVERQSNG